MDLNTKVERSIQLVREFARKFGKPWVLFSGGKDSLATLLLAVEALDGVRGVLYVEVTGNTHELCTRYVYRVAERLGLELVHTKREDLDFFEALVKWGIPHRVNRWCWNEFKVKVWLRVKPPIFLAGVKHADSRRRELADWSRPKQIYGMIVFSPIYYWSTQDVLDYIKSRIEPNPCYEIYGHSGNCMFCPFRRKSSIAKTMVDPYWSRKILGALACLRNEWGRREYRRWARFLVKPLTNYMEPPR